MVLLVVTQIQLQSVAVYFLPLDSFFIKKTICIQHIYLKFEKHTNISEKHKNVVVSRQTARLSAN